MTANRLRLHYFDILKGIAIVMVVMGHVLTMCIREIDRASAFKLISVIHMPLFFFISGWMSGRPTTGSQLPTIAKRFRQLIVPMVVVSSLWIWYFPHSGLQSPLNSSFAGLWGNEWKNGYWFTLVLFEIIVLWSVINRLKGQLKPSLCALVIWAVLLAVWQLVPAEAAKYASLELTVRFWPVFCFGAIAGRGDWFNRAAACHSAITVSILALSALLYYACYPWEFTFIGTIGQEIIMTLMHCCLAIVAVALVRPWSERSFADSHGGAWARMWSYIGRNSLAIYLLHYFFLFPLGCIRGVLESVNLAPVPLLAVAAAVAALIVATTLGANRIISLSPLLSSLLTGTIKKD